MVESDSMNTEIGDGLMHFMPRAVELRSEFGPALGFCPDSCRKVKGVFS